MKNTKLETANNNGASDVFKSDKLILEGDDLKAKNDFYQAKAAEEIAKEERFESDLEEARQKITDLTNRIEQSPNNYLTHYFRGCAFAVLGENEKAFDDFNEVIELSPNFTKAYINRAICYVKDEQYDDAIEDLSCLIKLKPNFYVA